MTDKEKKLINSLYQFYSTNVGGKCDFSEGDEVMYNRPLARHADEIGIYKGKRNEDGKIKIKYSNNIIFWADPKYVTSVEKPSEDLSKLYRILDQMVSDGDLNRTTVDKFKQEIDQKSKRKELDPYGEESWDEDEEDSILKPPKPKSPYKSPSYDPCSGSSSSRGGC